MKKRLWFLTFLITIFSILTILVVNKNNFIIQIDNLVNNFILTNQYESIKQLMLSITKLGNFYEVITISLVFGIFLLFKNKNYLNTFIITVFLGGISTISIKSLIGRDRPTSFIEQDFSFPSVHASIATIFLLSAIYLMSPVMKKGFSKNIFIISTYTIFPLVAFSRIYLSVHWLSDVIAGIILGVICFVSAIIISCYKKENVL